ncbi:hypothetical protein [Rubricoccus marinus]|uniref:hypothetical protein n=1 Tax=Rubricoccus marinus TaxID=716817 RepID=UPI001C52F5FB|nr:hypothetical protein [Rubricoccus marinus]
MRRPSVRAVGARLRRAGARWRLAPPGAVRAASGEAARPNVAARGPGAVHPEASGDRCA